MLLSAFRFSGDEVEESPVPRYLARGGLGSTLRSLLGIRGPGDPAAERLDSTGEVEPDVNGTVRCESSRMIKGFAECGGTKECAELATDGSRSERWRSTYQRWNV